MYSLLSNMVLTAAACVNKRWLLIRGVVVQMASAKEVRVVLCVLLGVAIFGCAPKPQASAEAGISNAAHATTADTAQSLGLDALPEECQPIEGVLMQCHAAMKTAQEAKRIIAVLSEQLKTAPAAEQARSCQDALTFWQSACGVAQ